jgi:NAD(P)-dependent dehydrogenase (short-subunit alcohol dehydrogenase family)
MGRNLLEGRVAIITGAGRGLGRTVACEFADEGASLALIDIDSQNLSETETILKEHGKQALTYGFDITDYGIFSEVIENILQRLGHIDVLVNNAAISIPGTILEDSLANWRKQLGINLEAVYMGTKMVVPSMIKQKFGRIVNISSIQGLVSSGMCGAYNAAKGAMIAFTKSLAVELAPYNVVANVVAPGFMRTPMSVVNGVDELATEDFLTWYVDKRHIPMGRAGETEDISGTVVFLASDYCRYMTGQVLIVDGGLTSTF